MATPKGAVIYRGPSLIDGAPIVVIITGLKGSKNEKTGSMVQTYILRDDLDPVQAIRSGADSSVCGDCAHRGEGFKGRTCYVNIGQGALSVWRAYHRGAYPLLDPSDAAKLVRGRMVRLGTYGDPAAAPAKVWRDLVKHAEGWTGYTHQWRRRIAQGLKRLCMASADSPEEAVLAHSKGWRTFRVSDPKAPNVGRETVCPASYEMGKRLQCIDCKACDGANGRRGSIRIAPHGAYSSAANLEALNARIIARAAA
jgi:hypothetical protein